MGRITEYIKKNSLVLFAYRMLTKIGFKGSIDYWESRYKKGGTSGEGSYGDLAKFKAKVINKFVKENGIKSVIEFGCGDGNQLTLMEYPLYLGLDVSKTAIDLCCKKFSNDSGKAFLWYDPMRFCNLNAYIKADVTLSLDVIYHLVEDDIYENYMKNLFAFSNKYVIIYASNEESVKAASHVRHRKFSDYVERTFPEYSLCKFIKNEYPNDSYSVSDFYIFEKKKG